MLFEAEQKKLDEPSSLKGLIKQQQTVIRLLKD